MRALAKAAKWEERATLPQPADLYAHFQRLPAQDSSIVGGAAEGALGPRRDRARPIAGPTRCTHRSARRARSRCSKDGALTVWSHTQGVYPLRGAIAEMLRVPPERVRCIHMEGSGCYGHNGADDAGADAALHRVRAARDGRCACSGCARTSTRGSRTAR